MSKFSKLLIWALGGGGGYASRFILEGRIIGSIYANTTSIDRHHLRKAHHMGNGLYVITPNGLNSTASFKSGNMINASLKTTMQLAKALQAGIQGEYTKYPKNIKGIWKNGIWEKLLPNDETAGISNETYLLSFFINYTF